MRGRPVDGMVEPLRRYTDFTWRSRRKEYWLFVLLYAALFAVASAIDHLLGHGFPGISLHPWGVSARFEHAGPARSLVALALLLPSLALGVRRLHDTDRRGWWMLLAMIPVVGSLVLLILFCREGTRGPNRYGGDPREIG